LQSENCRQLNQERNYKLNIALSPSRMSNQSNISTDCQKLQPRGTKGNYTKVKKVAIFPNSVTVLTYKSLA